MMNMMRTLAWFFLLCCCVSCFQRAGQSKENRRTMQTSHEEKPLKPEANKTNVEMDSVDGTEVEDEFDELHAGLLRLPCNDGQDTDTVYHYPTGKKVRIGRHCGRALYLELGEFYDENTYGGAKVYWGDSLIYATDLEIDNDWQTCHVYSVPKSEVTYVLLMINDRPSPNIWHILYMNGEHIHLVDSVLAGNDYIEGGSYFHDTVIYGDIDNDGWMEVGGKHWTEYWADSMTYQPCYIYQLGETTSEVCEATLKYLDTHELPDAFIMENYQISIGVMRALRQKKISVPEDISLLGVDEIPDYLTGDILLTTLRMEHLERAHVAMLFLEQEMKGAISCKFKSFSTCKIIPGKTVK